jgi:hypothetical protein
VGRESQKQLAFEFWVMVLPVIICFDALRMTARVKDHLYSCKMIYFWSKLHTYI